MQHEPKLSRRSFVFGLAGTMAMPLESTNVRLDIASYHRMMEQGGIDSLIYTVREQGFNLEPLLKEIKFDPKIGRFFATPEEKAKWQEQWDKWTPAERDAYTNAAAERFKKQSGHSYVLNNLKPFLKEHLETLVESETLYGIPKECTVAIIGTETKYGHVLGNRNPVDCLVSLYCTREDKREWAAKELVEFLNFTRKNEKDPKELKGSYAAAIGNAQFIPSSLNNYYVGNDPFNMPQSIMSVPHFLSHHLEDGKIERAIWHYNRSQVYVKVVMQTAEAARKIVKSF